MDNPARTADYFARRDSRMDSLQDVLAHTLRTKPVITLEIGCGHGHFLTAYATAHPERFCVGIDMILDRITRAGRKQNRAKLANLTFIRAEAHEFLASLPAETRFTDIFILFPDPWPKRRHHKNRIIQPQFLSALAERAGEGARLCFRTDYAAYFTDAQATIAEHAAWQLSPTAAWPFETPTVFQNRAPAYDSLIALRRPIL